MPAATSTWQGYQSAHPRNPVARGALSGVSFSLRAPFTVFVISWEHAVRVSGLQQVLHLLSGERARSPQLVLKRLVSRDELVHEGKDAIPRGLPRVGQSTKAALRQVERKIGDGIWQESTQDKMERILRTYHDLELASPA